MKYRVTQSGDKKIRAAGEFVRLEDGQDMEGGRRKMLEREEGQVHRSVQSEKTAKEICKWRLTLRKENQEGCRLNARPADP